MFRRVLLKLSGEVLSGEGGSGFSQELADYLVQETGLVIDLSR